MELNSLPLIDIRATAEDHGFVFDAHNHDRSRLITRYRGTSVIAVPSGSIVTGWQKSIYHFGGLNREVPVVVTIELDPSGAVSSISIDEKSLGSQGRRCDFNCLEDLCREKLCGTAITDLGRAVSSASDVKCLHLFEILIACSSFCAYLSSRGLHEGCEHEFITISPDKSGLTADSIHDVCGRKDHARIRMDNIRRPVLDVNGLASALDTSVLVRYNEDEVLKDELHASGFEAVYAQLNRLFSRCHHYEKDYFGISGRSRFFNTPSMTGLVLLAISHSNLKGSVSRAMKIERILHYLQTGYGKNPCKGFGG